MLTFLSIPGGMVKWYADVLKQLPKLKLISLCSIGTDMIDLETAKQQGIVVCNQPRRTAPVVAEHSFGLMFGLAKRTAYLTQSLKSGIWPRMDNIYLQGKTLGIIGTRSYRFGDGATCKCYRYERYCMDI